MLRPEEWTPSPGIILDDSALRIVRANENQIVLAGPGSGKTELLAQRAMYLLQTGLCAPPQRILALSFKVDAAANLRQRVRRRCGSELAERFDSATFDAFAKSLVDRFREALPAWCRPERGYQIFFANDVDWTEFLRGLAPPPDVGPAREAFATSKTALSRISLLPEEEPNPTKMRGWVLKEWIKRQISRNELTFDLLRLLARTVIEYNPSIVNAIRLTYSHVFLDEYQDTTKIQFDTVAKLFAGTTTNITAVGDTKQRIMTFAGAQAEVFTWAAEQFNASPRYLQVNHRSNERLVKLINSVATALEPDAVPARATRQDPVPRDWATYLQFDTADQESNWIATKIHEGLQAGLRPADFAVLTRIRVDRVEARLGPALAQHEIPYLNEARQFEGVALQDLLPEPVMLAIQALVCLGLGRRGPEIYDTVREFFGALFATSAADPNQAIQLDDRIKNFVSEIARDLKASPHSDAPAVVERWLQKLGAENIQRAFPKLRGPYFQKYLKALLAYVEEISQSAQGWSDIGAELLGGDRVRLMTIHKSKGLEFHTVFFVGIDSRSYRDMDGDEMNSFFVALSRARERIFFTYSPTGGAQVPEIIGILQTAGVPFAHGN